MSDLGIADEEAMLNQEDVEAWKTELVQEYGFNDVEKAEARVKSAYDQKYAQLDELSDEELDNMWKKQTCMTLAQMVEQKMSLEEASLKLQILQAIRGKRCLNKSPREVAEDKRKREYKKAVAWRNRVLDRANDLTAVIYSLQRELEAEQATFEGVKKELSKAELEVVHWGIPGEE